MLVKEAGDALVMELKYTLFLDPQSQGQAQEARQLGNALSGLQRSCSLGLWR